LLGCAGGKTLKSGGGSGALGRRAQGVTADLARFGLKHKASRNEEEGRRVKRESFTFSKNNQTTEFKHSKIMHQHECNSKLLYFIS
jgi:hypothetical protein